VEGEIKCRNLFVEDQAVLTGSIEAEETVVSGQVNGEVNAETLRITNTGVFDGVIKTAGIEVENGAHVTAKFRKRRR
jgi:cytoskeletal protein CcmA (bactofilin family)